MFKKILVPIDGSEQAKKALHFALDLADKYNAEVEILTVIRPLELWNIPVAYSAAPFASSEDLKKVISQHEEMLAEALAEANKKKPDLTISTKYLEGRPADKIVERVKNEGFELIVMGSRGLGGVKEFVLGSVSDRVTDDTECPVLIVK